MIYSKKGQRRLSLFAAKEMVFDYIDQKLDQDRMTSFQKLRAETREIEPEINKINFGLEYAKTLQKINITEKQIEEVKRSTKWVDQLVSRFGINQWSPSVKLLIEFISISVGVVFFVSIVPWQKILENNWNKPEESFVIAKIEKQKITAPETKIEEQKPEFKDEGLEKPGAKLVEIAKENKSATTAKSSTPVEEKKESGSKSEGALYRGRISVVNLDATSAKLVDKISSLGGRKAGSVQLGWKKGNGTYFHFTIPQNKYDQLLQYFSTFGTLKINKEKHDRVMPEGIMRVIIEVEEK